MYLPISIPPEDRPKFRLLWRNSEADREPDVYEFEHVVFEDASAPFRAQLVSQRIRDREKIDVHGRLVGFKKGQ